jgi:hypothetical protein
MSRPDGTASASTRSAVLVDKENPADRHAYLLTGRATRANFMKITSRRPGGAVVMQKIKKGDMVEVIAGRNKGEKGRVPRCSSRAEDPRRGDRAEAPCEGGRAAEHAAGGILDRPGKIHIPTSACGRHADKGVRGLQEEGRRRHGARRARSEEPRDRSLS